MRKHRGSDLWKDCPVKVPKYQLKSSVSMISLFPLSVSIVNRSLELLKSDTAANT